MNLVMIGHVKDATAAETAHDTIKAATEAIQGELDAGRLVMGEPGDGFTDEMLKTVGDLRLHSIGARELKRLARCSAGRPSGSAGSHLAQRYPAPAKGRASSRLGRVP